MLLQQKKLELREQVHFLKPIVMIGDKGLTEAVQKEIESALLAHELVKIRISGADKVSRKEIIKKICKNRKADLIQSIGHIIAIYRKKPEKKTDMRQRSVKKVKR